MVTYVQSLGNHDKIFFQEKRLDTALRVDRTMDLEECRVIQQRIDNFTTVRNLKYYVNVLYI